MTCFTCKGDTEKSLTTYMTEYNGCFLIIKNVPCTKCTQCGEEYLNGVTLQKMESIPAKPAGNEGAGENVKCALKCPSGIDIFPGTGHNKATKPIRVWIF